MQLQNFPQSGCRAVPDFPRAMEQILSQTLAELGEREFTFTLCFVSFQVRRVERWMSAFRAEIVALLLNCLFEDYLIEKILSFYILTFSAEEMTTDPKHSGL